MHGNHLGEVRGSRQPQAELQVNDVARWPNLTRAAIVRIAQQLGRRLLKPAVSETYAALFALDARWYETLVFPSRPRVPVVVGEVVMAKHRILRSATAAFSFRAGSP